MLTRIQRNSPLTVTLCVACARVRLTLKSQKRKDYSEIPQTLGTLH